MSALLGDPRLVKRVGLHQVFAVQSVAPTAGKEETAAKNWSPMPPAKEAKPYSRSDQHGGAEITLLDQEDRRQ